MNVEETAQAVESGQAAFVDHAVVRTDSGVTARFLNTASLGGYPDAVRLREKNGNRVSVSGRPQEPR